MAETGDILRREIKALAFDQYGTIVDMQKGLTEVVTPFLKREGLGWKTEQFCDVVAPHSFRKFNDRRVMRSRAYAVPSDRTSRGLIVMDRCGITFTQEEVSWLVSEIEKLKPFSDVVAALEKLRTSGYKLTILSNGDRDMLKAAGPHIGIFKFDHVISVQEAGTFKPHWKTYAKAEEIIGYAPLQHLVCRQSCLRLHWCKVIWHADRIHRPPQATIWRDATSTGSYCSEFCRVGGGAELDPAMKRVGRDRCLIRRGL